jgi:glyoxylase-like metal-dependent hydrolase (beta-lactamase superfamily II)
VGAGSIAPKAAILRSVAEYIVEEAAAGLYALAVWDEAAGSYNNCYLLREGGRGAGRALLVDSGKAQHAPALREALARLGVSAERLVAVVATHGHHDHVGGAAALPGVSKHIHAADAGLLPATGRWEWHTDLPDRGPVPGLPHPLGLECVVLGQHTTGSVALYHAPTRALFWGDHACFFGAPLDDEGLVGVGAARRERMLRGAAWRAAHWPPDAAELQRIDADLAGRRPEDQRRHDFPLQLAGAERALALGEAELLCTGHGPVLRGGVAALLAGLIAAARGAFRPPA